MSEPWFGHLMGSDTVPIATPPHRAQGALGSALGVRGMRPVAALYFCCLQRGSLLAWEGSASAEELLSDFLGLATTAGSVLGLQTGEENQPSVPSVPQEAGGRPPHFPACCSEWGFCRAGAVALSG